MKYKNNTINNIKIYILFILINILFLSLIHTHLCEIWKQYTVNKKLKWIYYFLWINVLFFNLIYTHKWNTETIYC